MTQEDKINSFKEAKEKAVKELRFERLLLTFLYKAKLWEEVKAKLELCSLLEKLIKEYDVGLADELCEEDR